MKSLILALSVMIFMGCTVQKDFVHVESIAKYENTCIQLLNNEKPAIVEDALFLILSNDIFSNKRINNPVYEKLVFLTEHGKTEKIRKRALIISDYLNIENKFVRILIKAECLNKEKLFEIVTSNLKEKELSESTISHK